MLEIFYFLLFDPRAFDTAQGVCYDNALDAEEPVERAECRDDPVKGLGLVGPHCRDKREEIRDHGGRDIDAGIKPCILEVFPEENKLGNLGMAAEPDIVAEMLDHLLIAVERPLGIVPHPQVVPVAFEPLRKIPAIHGLFYFCANK